MSAEVVWLVTVVLLRPIHAERHPTVEFPTCESCRRKDEYCWRKGVEVMTEEARGGVIAGFVCKEARR